MKNLHLAQAISGNFEKNYLFPFLWVHGVAIEEVYKEMDAIKQCGIDQICIESRTYEAFSQDEWWVDFGKILAYAEKNGMKIWLFDDKHFPTGSGNDYIKSHPELRKKLLRMCYHDVFSNDNISAMLTPTPANGESLISVIAYKRSNNMLYGEPVVLTFKNGLTDISELQNGIWRIFYFYSGFYQEEQLQYHCDMLSYDSCQAMIKGVYDPHYEHFKEYFGNTFLGFFSDEPAFFNETSYDSVLGKSNMKIPWRDDLCDIMNTDFTMLPLLWQKDKENRMAEVRLNYMDTVTRLYKENFGDMLGNWCREKGVMYIGHVIEDMGAHMRLGYGAGHYFRALNGQDMGGIDLVLQQIIPGFISETHDASTGYGDINPAFNRYLLAKLAVSHSHIDPKKKNRAMCEIFGAYGWAGGIPIQRKLVDHMLACGINNFVPHAFSDIHNDCDCPPHFYNKGDNIQYKLFGQLSKYMQRVAHIISQGQHKSDVALLYTPEGEWSGGKMVYPEDIAIKLTQNQIDFDIIPEDGLPEYTVKDGKLIINNESYGALLVPKCDYLPNWITDNINRLKQDMPVYYVDESFDYSLLPSHFKLPFPFPELRFYHLECNGTEVWLFLNENEEKACCFPFKEALRYDAYDNLCYKANEVNLSPGELGIFIVGENTENLPDYQKLGEEIGFKNKIKISLKGFNETEFTLSNHNNLYDVNYENPEFCGTIRYEFKVPSDIKFIDLGVVGEAAEIFLNGQYIGSRITNPYIIPINTTKESLIRVDVVNNQAYRFRDFYSHFLPLPVGGILGPIKLYK